MTAKTEMRRDETRRDGTRRDDTSAYVFMTWKRREVPCERGPRGRVLPGDAMDPTTEMQSGPLVGLYILQPFRYTLGEPDDPLFLAAAFCTACFSLDLESVSSVKGAILAVPLLKPGASVDNYRGPVSLNLILLIPTGSTV